ncbi:hypothetical protein D917_02081 [Trichinella nativa]|uniref:Uncharacterized protein n=1 Tax=Trichinella nativa TaxID=6335 RepID=A0A1Y3EJ22_9BILA|nr:hypothetical protein D917_02081 [Trichinella nativa]
MIITSVSSLCLLISNESNSDEVHCKFLDEIMVYIYNYDELFEYNMTDLHDNVCK